MARTQVLYDVIKQMLGQMPKQAAEQTPKLLKPSPWTTPTGQSVFRDTARASILPKLAAGGTITSAVLGSPEDSEALMLPEVRAAMLKAIEAGGKQVFHHAREAGKLVEEGIQDPLTVAKQLEQHKPMGLYLTDKPKKIPGHLSGVYADTSTSKGLKSLLARDMMNNAMQEGTTADNTIRMVIDPTARIKSMYEKDMHGYNEEVRNIYRDLWSREHPQEPLQANPFVAGIPREAKAQHYQDIADVLHIKDVDDQPGLSEYILLNPDKASMFYENMYRTPEEGLKIVGPAKNSSVFQKVEDERRWGDILNKYNKFYFSRPSQKQLDAISDMFKLDPNGFTDEELSYLSKQGDKIHPELQEAVAPTPQEVPFKGLKAEQPVKEFDLKSKIDLYQSLVNSAIKEGNEPQISIFQNELFKLQSQFDPKINKAIAGLAGGGAIAGAVLGSPDEAQALPLGNIKALNRPIANAIRSKDAFGKLIGNFLPNGMEIVDVQKNPNNDWRYIIAKDINGKRFQLPMTKDYLEAYMGAVGTKKYLNKFENVGELEKEMQAVKSMDIRTQKRNNTSDVKPSTFHEWNKAQVEKVKQIDPSLVHDYAYVKVLDGSADQPIYMPRAYADYLAKKGLVKILKR